MRLIASTAVAALTLVAGCGGDGSETFQADALEICRETNERIRILGSAGIESFPQTQLFARQANDAVGDQIDGLEELEPPPEQADQFELYLATLEERRRILARLTDAADRNSMNDVRETGTELQTLGDTAREQAAAAGIAECEPS